MSENQQFSVSDSTENKLNYRHAAFDEENNGLLPLANKNLKPKHTLTSSTTTPNHHQNAKNHPI